MWLTYNILGPANTKVSHTFLASMGMSISGRVYDHWTPLDILMHVEWKFG